MIFVLLSIASSLVIFIVFKLLDRFKANTFQAIIWNYIFAFAFGLTSNQKVVDINEILGSSWFWGSLVVGGLFICTFYLMAITAQRNGISVASVAAKMSVVIPIVFGFVLYSEKVSLLKITGILLAVSSVYLVSTKSKTAINFKKNLWLPSLLFVGSGVTDASINYFQQYHLSEETIPLFSAGVFGFAGILGSILIAVGIYRKKIILDWKSSFGGLILGCANYASLYYIIKSLQLPNMESSRFFTINNVSIVMFSTLIGLMFFKEKLITINWFGIILAITAIYLMTLSAA